MRRTGLEIFASRRHCLPFNVTETRRICCAHDGSNFPLYSTYGTWNAIINGYCKSGNSQHALQLYQEMQTNEGSLQQLSGHIYVVLLKACAILRDLKSGLHLHAEVARTGNLRNPFVGSTLVDVYIKCGLLAKAQESFDVLFSKDVVAWTTLMAGYADHGHTEEALLCFDKMQHNGASPDAHVFVCVLKVCTSIISLENGEYVHATIERLGMVGENIYVASALVGLYAKCGSLGKAQEVFDRCSCRNAILWNVLLLGYADHGHNEAVLVKYEQMQLNGFSPTIISYVCVLKVCGILGALDKGRDIHAEIVRRGLIETDNIAGNVLVDMYSKGGVLTVAQEVFDGLPSRDVVSWTALISGYVQHGQHHRVGKCFDQMYVEGILPNAATCVCIFTACGNARAAMKGCELHAKVEVGNLFGRDPLVGNSLVNMYSKCGMFSMAEKVFEKLLVRDVVSWTALIVGCVELDQGQQALEYYQKMKFLGVFPNEITYIYVVKACGSTGALKQADEVCTEIERLRLLETDLDLGNALIELYTECGSLFKALDVFYKLPSRDSISYGTLIAGCVGHGKGEEALKRFNEMQLEGIFPNAATHACIVKACGCLGAKERGIEIHVEIEKRGLLEINQVVGNSLVDMYAKFGLLAAAKHLFIRLPVCDLVSWNVLIGGYAWLGEWEVVFSLFEQMQAKGLKPDLVTFVIILGACRRIGLFGNNKTHFEVMSKEYGIFPHGELCAWGVGLSCHLD